MLVHRCDNQNCKKEFTEEGSLKQAIFKLDGKSAELQFCPECIEKFRIVIEDFVKVKPQVATKGADNATV